jgi:hypothetical protein
MFCFFYNIQMECYFCVQLRALEKPILKDQQPSLYLNMLGDGRGTTHFHV